MANTAEPPRKLPAELESPVDTLLYQFVPCTATVAHGLRLTPNMITGISAVFGVLAIMALRDRRLAAFSVCFGLSYFFDCVDGYVARKYNQVTVLGDWLDHVKDIAVYVCIATILVARMCAAGQQGACVLLTSLVVLYLAIVHMYFTERRYCESDETGSRRGCSAILMSAGAVVPSSAFGGTTEERLRRTRWFGMGTAMLATIVAAWLV